MEEAGGFTVFAHFLKDKLHLALFEKRQFIYYNSFSYTSANDVLYYVLLVYNQFKLETAVTPLYLSGHILENSEIFKILFRYITELRFMPEPSFLKFSKKFSEVPPHFYSDLVALSLFK